MGVGWDNWFWSTLDSTGYVGKNGAQHSERRRNSSLSKRHKHVAIVLFWKTRGTSPPAIQFWAALVLSLLDRFYLPEKLAWFISANNLLLSSVALHYLESVNNSTCQPLIRQINFSEKTCSKDPIKFCSYGACRDPTKSCTEAFAGSKRGYQIKLSSGSKPMVVKYKVCKLQCAG